MHEQNAKIMELVRMHGAAWHASGASHHIPGEAARYEVMAESRREEIEEALRALACTTSLTDAQIDKVFELMPDGPQGFLKNWGYRQFAHELLEAAASQARAPVQSEPANHRLTLMVDAAMVEMQGIYPPLRRSECQRLITAALSAAPAGST